MRKVLIYFQDDRARHRQQKGWPPCGPRRTTPTIRKGQRDHLSRVRRGSRGPSRNYVVAKVQVRLAFSHQALPAFPFLLLVNAAALLSLRLFRVLASFDLDLHSCFRGTNLVSEIKCKRHSCAILHHAPGYAGRRENHESYVYSETNHAGAARRIYQCRK